MIVLPDFALNIIKTLKSNGFEAYAVGGCVRDAIIEKTSYDIDITTSALPDQIQAIFPHSVRTGGKFYTVIVIHGSGKAEVTTFRSEGSYSDSRHPDTVAPATSLFDDVMRRDFTINSICFDGEKIVDLLDGTNDINGKIIRCIGNPSERFSEDALRIMRAFRFSASLGYEIDPITLEAAISLSDTIQQISIERIRDELIKVLDSDSPERIAPLLKCGALKFIGIEYSPVIESLRLIKRDTAARLCAFIYYCGKSSAEKLKLSNKQKVYYHSVAALLDSLPSPSKTEIKYAMNKFTAHCLETALCISKITSNISVDYFEIYNEIISNNEPYRLSDLSVSGDDLINLGVPSNEIGTTLNKLLNHVIKTPKDNTAQILMNLI